METEYQKFEMSCIEKFKFLSRYSSSLLCNDNVSISFKFACPQTKIITVEKQNMRSSLLIPFNDCYE